MNNQSRTAKKKTIIYLIISLLLIGIIVYFIFTNYSIQKQTENIIKDNNSLQTIDKEEVEIKELEGDKVFKDPKYLQLEELEINPQDLQIGNTDIFSPPSEVALEESEEQPIESNE